MTGMLCFNAFKKYYQIMESDELLAILRLKSETGNKVVHNKLF